MTTKPILIAFATRGGTTQKVAENLARALREHQTLVEVRPIEQVRDLSSYRAVVVGSGMRDEKWLPEAVRFVREHQQALKQVPLVYFLVYSDLLQAFPQRVEEVLGHLSEVRQTVEPLEVAIFSRDPTSLPPQMQVNTKAMPDGPWGNWDSLQNWAGRLYQTFNRPNTND